MGEKLTVQMVRCCDIEIPAARHRREMGSLQSLADSIGKLGLLHPVGITPGRDLIFGERRLRAVRDILKRDTIAVRIFDLDLDLSLEAEHAENEERKALTLSERHDLLRALEARREEKRGRPEKEENRADKNGGNRRHLNRSDETEAREAGFDSAREARRVKTVMESGTPELIEAMESGEVSVDAAAVIATKPTEEQQRIVSLEEGRRRQEVKRARAGKKQQQKQKARKKISDPDAAYAVMEALERIAETRLDVAFVARWYAGHRRPTAFRKIQLAIVFLEDLAKIYPAFEEGQKRKDEADKADRQKKGIR